MPEIGVRELKARASGIVRDIREHGTIYTITYRGKPVGVLRPVAEAREQAEDEASPWEALRRLGQEISAHRETDRHSADILSEMRR